MKKLYFITGSQDLYGDETLRQVAADSAEMVKFLNDRLKNTVKIVCASTVRNAEEAEDICLKATCDRDCVGVICWMHTFSPAKAWIRGLQALKKPMLHLHRYGFYESEPVRARRQGIRVYLHAPRN